MSQKKPKLIPPPKHCDCGRVSNIVMIEVIDAKNQRRIGPFSDFATGVGKHRTLRDAYTFKRWIVHCWDCYHRQTGQEEMFG